MEQKVEKDLAILIKVYFSIVIKIRAGWRNWKAQGTLGGFICCTIIVKYIENEIEPVLFVVRVVLVNTAKLLKWEKKLFPLIL